ncbi:aspartate kinase [Mucilaginibacter myungsuensis]|uniref:aspartate kinase n=1 Tax=Mucilaginibacter myungsuensis TaxID=649104 RepID=A0A929PVM5_9SPHI|nr:aspartate kinase [Mucilaginibacter myungsuensis]MBE9660470.1 aspartate kinase [Mucilaginibacter myungsuensis]MDN3600512.1 aspartate kinase [Mucilaginibacter myungsuensis]
MLTVEKIGGTSMSALKNVIDNIILFNRTGDELYNRIFVVSAFSGVTNLLLENKKTAEPGVYHRLAQMQDFHKPLIDLVAKLKEINTQYVDLGLNLAAADEFIEKHVADAQKYLENLSNILASGYVSRDNILQAAREILASIGESHSAWNFTNILQNMGINATLVDLSGLHDNRPFTIDQRIKHAFDGIELAKTICIVTGYVKGTEGIMREFDRGYSEVTFSKIAEELKPTEAIIHKEYHLSTADPGIVGIENCHPVGNTNYDIADQLADVGMEAIHPKASKPLEINGINLRIKNTFEPAHQGTLITKDFICETKRVEVITGTDKLILIDVYDPLMVSNVGTDLKIMQVFFDHNVSYIFKATSANSISIVIWERDLNDGLIQELEANFEKIAVEKTAMVCMLGTNMDQPGLLARAAAALTEAGINIMSAGFALRKVNIQFLVARESFKDAVIALNRAMAN